MVAEELIKGVERVVVVHEDARVQMQLDELLRDVQHRYRIVKKRFKI
jgi:hypothetical protein